MFWRLMGFTMVSLRNKRYSLTLWLSVSISAAIDYPGVIGWRSTVSNYEDFVFLWYFFAFYGRFFWLSPIWSSSAARPANNSLQNPTRNKRNLEVGYYTFFILRPLIIAFAIILSLEISKPWILFFCHRHHLRWILKFQETYYVAISVSYFSVDLLGNWTIV